MQFESREEAPTEIILPLNQQDDLIKKYVTHN